MQLHQLSLLLFASEELVVLFSQIPILFYFANEGFGFVFISNFNVLMNNTESFFIRSLLHKWENYFTFPHIFSFAFIQIKGTFEFSKGERLLDALTENTE